MSEIIICSIFIVTILFLPALFSAYSTPDFIPFLAALIITIVCSLTPTLIARTNKKKKQEDLAIRQEKLKKEYQICLNNLTKVPDNIELRRKALQTGREYSSSLREGGAVTIFDEAAINNDLSAIIGKSNLVKKPLSEAELRGDKPIDIKNDSPEPEKECPMCAEKVKQKAKICRFCGHIF